MGRLEGFKGLKGLGRSECLARLGGFSKRFPERSGGIARSKPSSMVFAILTHCLGATDMDNYSIKQATRSIRFSPSHAGHGMEHCWNSCIKLRDPSRPMVWREY